MTATIGSGTIGGGGDGSGDGPPPVHPGSILGYVERSTDLVTTEAPIDSEVYAVMDDGTGLGIQPTPGGAGIPLEPGDYSVEAAILLEVSANSTEVWFGAESQVNGGAWNAPDNNISKPLGTAGASDSIAIIAQFTIPAAVEIKFRFRVARAGGPGGSTVTAHTLSAHITRLSP